MRLISGNALQPQFSYVLIPAQLVDLADRFQQDSRGEVTTMNVLFGP